MIAVPKLAPCLQSRSLMKKKILCTAVVLGFSATFSPFSLFAGVGFPRQRTQAVVSAHQKKTVATFERHLNDYLKQRMRVKAKLPNLSNDSTPEQIEAYQKAFVEGLRAARAGTRAGYMFQPAVAGHIRATIKTEFQGKEGAELRETVLEADTKGVPLQVNYPYPETKELTQIPPTLLLKLPELPKEVKYRFVGRHLLLVDTDNALIIDYMLNAIP